MTKKCGKKSNDSPIRRDPQVAGTIIRKLRLPLGLLMVWALTFMTSQCSVANHLQELFLPLPRAWPMTPPMGWSSWNAYFEQIDESVIERAADAMVNSGMKAVGYRYVNIDGGWWNGTRDANGNIVVNTGQWPGGMRAVTAYIHSKGLNAGIYTDVGVDGCTGKKTNQGSYGHYLQDMMQFEQWGFDFVKVDWCGGKEMGLDPAKQYRQIRDALIRATAQTKRPMVLSICNWGLADPWKWGPTTGNLWRTSSDISSQRNSVSWANVLKNFDSATFYPPSQTPGAYNDADMMEVGVSGLTDTENQSHFSLWAIAGAPLLSGNDITSMSNTTKMILTNQEVIAIDQDPLGLQGTQIGTNDTNSLQVWSKVLSVDGQRAVVLLNRTSSTANMTVNWSDIGLAAGSTQVRDLWAHSTLGNFSDSYTTSVAPHGVVMLKISGREGVQTTYEAESPANTLNGSASVKTCSSCSGGRMVEGIGNSQGNNGTLQFNNIQATLPGPQVITIFYISNDNTPRMTLLSINGSPDTTIITFPSTGNKSNPTVGSVKIMVNFKTGNNTLLFSNDTALAPDFDKITTPVAQMASTYEAESPKNTLGGKAGVSSCTVCSGGSDVGHVGNGDGGNGTLQFNNIILSNAGIHQIVISYINGEGSEWGIGSSRTAFMSINGQPPFEVHFPASGDWHLVLTMKLEVHLTVGKNTIAFSNSTSWTPDFDKIDVV